MRYLAVILTIIGVWMGVATANELKGWRTLILPVLYIVVMVVTLGFLVTVVKGTAYTLNGLLQSLGLATY